MSEGGNVPETKVYSHYIEFGNSVGYTGEYSFKFLIYSTVSTPFNSITELRDYLANQGSTYVDYPLVIDKYNTSYGGSYADLWVSAKLRINSANFMANVRYYDSVNNKFANNSLTEFATFNDYVTEV